MQQKTVVVWSIEYGTNGTAEEGPFAQHHLDYHEWENLRICVAVLQPAATIVKDLEGTLYVTASQVLPCVYAVLKKASNRDAFYHWDERKVSESNLYAIDTRLEPRFRL